VQVPDANIIFIGTANFNSVHWIVPTIAGVFLSASILLIFVAYLNYLTDTYLMYAASALAANTVARSACGAAAPLFTDYMFTSMGVGGGGSLIGGVACLLAIIPFLFYKYGQPIRERSKFAPTGPKEPANASPPTPRDEEMQTFGSDSEGDDERALDEEMGVPEGYKYRGDGASEMATPGQSASDLYLNADGTEKAEAPHTSSSNLGGR